MRCLLLWPFPRRALLRTCVTWAHLSLTPLQKAVTECHMWRAWHRGRERITWKIFFLPPFLSFDCYSPTEPCVCKPHSSSTLSLGSFPNIRRTEAATTLLLLARRACSRALTSPVFGRTLQHERTYLIMFLLVPGSQKWDHLQRSKNMVGSGTLIPTLSCNRPHTTPGCDTIYVHHGVLPTP